MARRRYRTPVVTTPLGRYVCERCGQRFAWQSERPKYGGRQPRYCSEECRLDTPKTHRGTCICGRPIWSARSKDVFWCSSACSKKVRAEPLPADHWARWVGRSSPWKPPLPDPARTRFVAGQCCECGNWFIGDRAAFFSLQSSAYCSGTCAARVARRRRRAREFGLDETYRWLDVIGVWLMFDKRCAYCDELIDGQPQPDHVVPLSRGGRNLISNILPCCAGCNRDKNDLTLAEWQSERERRHLPPRRYRWSRNDVRFRHVLLTEPSTDAARFRRAS